MSFPNTGSRLDGRVALVTGALGGIGAATCKALAAGGAKVIASDAHSSGAEALLDAMKKLGASCAFFPLDVTKRQDWEALMPQIESQFGLLDILVNNAGGSRSFKDLHVSEEAWQEAITLNFHRPRQVADALIDQMIARKWGRIINITGKSEPDHVNGAFCAKAGIHSWAKGLSRMVGPHGITVNCIPPGRNHSEQIFRNYTPEYRQWQCENEIPMGRYGEPEDMVNLVTFLSSPLASYITGAVIPVDGGLRRYQF